MDQTNCSKVENLEDFEKQTFEHTELPDKSTKKDALLPQRPIWLRTVNNVRTIIQQQNEYIYIPDLRAHANA